jgi:hypothetical protein
MITMIRRTILASTVAGMTALGIAAPVFAGVAFAEPSPKPPQTRPTPLRDAKLNVTVTPNEVQPGKDVKIGATSEEGIFGYAVATSPVFSPVKLTEGSNGAEGIGHVRDDARAGVYTVIVKARGKDQLKFVGTARLTVVVTTPTPPAAATPTVPTVPKGGVGTGGGGTAYDGTNLGMLTAGSAIALLGVIATVAAIRRRRSDVRK